MKKLFVSVLAIAGLVACSQEQTLVQQGPSPVEFGVAGIENATRVDPSIKTETLTGFNVWAWMDAEDGNVLTAEDVEKVGDQWGYANVAYWLPGHNYSFAAVAPMDSANWKYNLNGTDNGEDNTITFKNIDGTEDLIYAFATQSTTNKVDEDYEAVKLVFNHLLSKTKFTFVNGYATANNPIQVRDVQVKVMNAATYNIAAAKWSEVAGEEITLKYGNTEEIAAGAKCAVADERLTIPASKEMSYEVTYTVDVWQGEKKAIDGLVKTTVIKNLELEQGKAYNFVATISPESLNLDAIEFEIVVNEWDEQDMNMGQIEDEVIFVSTIGELQAALDAATGDTTVVLGADLKGNVTVNEIADATIAIYGNDYKFDGCFRINGKSTYANATTVFDGINFETADNSSFIGSGDAFIYCGEHDGTNFRYPDNVTVKNCTFKGTETVVGIKFWSLNGNLVVENCKAEAMHSLMQLTSCGEAVVLVDGAEVKDCKNGISLQYAGSNTIRNSAIVAREYGIRADGSVAATTIENTTIEAKQPVIVRKVTTGNYALNFADCQLITAEPYQVIFTAKSDDVAYEVPTAPFTLTGAENFVVYPNDAVSTTDELDAALANANVESVVLAGNITYSSSETVLVAKDFVINGNGQTITAGAAKSLTPSIASDGEYNVVINDTNIVGGFVGAYYGANITVNGGSLKFTEGQSGRNCFYAASTTDKTAIITINDVDVNMANASGNSYLCAHGNAIIYVNGGNFYGKPVGSSNAYVKEAAIGSYTGKVIITGGTFNFDPSAYVAAGYVATKSGSTWTVSKQ